MMVSSATMLGAGLYEKFFQSKFSDYIGPESVVAAVRRFMVLLDAPTEQFRAQPVTGLFLHGSDGTGKSMFAAIIAKHVLLKLRQRVRVVPAETMVGIFKDEPEEYADMLDMRLLVIDDLDRTTVNAFVRNVVERAVVYRSSRKLATILVAADCDSLAEAYGKKVQAIVESEYAEVCCPVVEAWLSKRNEAVVESLFREGDENATW